MKVFSTAWMLIFLSLLQPVTKAVAAEETYDVIVVGAGTGGVSAAVQAARSGSSVLLLEESDWIGGQIASGVSTMDDGASIVGPQGIYSEFRSRIEAIYAAHGKSVGTCYYSNVKHCYEPSVAQKVFYSMIADANGTARQKKLTVRLRTTVVKLLTTGDTITGVMTNTGAVIHSKIVIDATEYGDILPLSPAVYRSGNNVSDQPVHPACVQDITYVMIVRKYPKGVPADLVMKDAPPGYQESEFRKQLQRSVQRDGNTEMAGTRPESWAEDMTLPVSWAGQNVYRGMPDSSANGSYSASQPLKITRTQLNWFNDYPADIDILDRSKRHDIVCRAKLKTLYYLYYVQHELGETQWSVANDEGYDTPYNRENACSNIPEEYKAIEWNMPQIPYVRESRRLVGEHTLTGLEMRREGTPAMASTSFDTSIAVGDNGNDLHGCNAETDMEVKLEHVGDLVGDRGLGNGPFQIPLSTLIPEHVDGFLVAEKNLSQSRLANGATRLQPITMLTGQAAGVLAALAIKEGVQPRAVNVQDVQIQLLQANSNLALASGILDAPVADDTWRAAEFALTHEWLSMDSPSLFGFGDVLTRGDAATTLSQTFGLNGKYVAWRKNQLLRPTFEDVPLYTPYSLPVEALATRGAVEPCEGAEKLFCPTVPATQTMFVEGLIKLAANSESISAHMSSHEVEAAHKWSSDVFLTKGTAAKILYWYVVQRSSQRTASLQREK